MKLTVINCGQKSLPIEQAENFPDLIRSDVIAQKTEDAIARLIGKIGIYTITDLRSRIVAPKVEAEEASSGQGQGVCTIASDGISQVLLVGDQFKEYLAEEGGFNTTHDAEMFAAIYARSLEALSVAVNNGKSYRKIRTNFRNSMNERYWGPEFINGNNSTLYRAAGLVAITATEEDPDFNQRPPYAPHIAGIMDPLPAQGRIGFIQLVNILM